MSDQPIFWSDQLAFGVTRKFPDRDTYVCASGISPSGIVHAGNFREIITTDFVVKSLKERGEDTKFIYYWDDYDRFRKVPANVPDEWEQYIGLPLCDVPDPWECHGSYADHFIKRLEEEVQDMKMDIDFVRQSRNYRDCVYADLIKVAMNDTGTIREILNQYRNEPLEDDWRPLRIYCTECGKDFTEITDYDGEHTVEYRCSECGEDRSINFKTDDSVKLPWRVQWPMWWEYADISFEPGGKDHSAAGSSRDTGEDIVREVYGREPPIYQMYEFVTKDGAKISGSEGEDAFTLTDLKQIYTPEMIRFLFSSTRPDKAFEIPFASEEIFQRYDEFDRIEETYFGPDDGGAELRTHEEAVYELAVVEIPDEQPVRVPFKHASFIAQTVPEEEWGTKAIESLKRTGHVPEGIGKTGVEQVLERLEKARTWAREYAPQEYRYEINHEVPEDVLASLDEDQVEAMKILAEKVREGFRDQDDLDGKIFDARDQSSLETGEFFQTAYQVFLSRQQGPRLSRLIVSLGQEEAAEILGQVE